MDEKSIYIKITKNGPYLVYGAPDITLNSIVANEEGTCTNYKIAKVFDFESNPIALCRCGNSQNPPFCDGNHKESGFDGTECARFDPILNNATKYEGPRLVLADNEEYCAFARFCDANGSIWNLIYQDNDFAEKEVLRQANLCPSGRLLVFDKKGNLLEENIPQSISVLEDTGLKISGPIWLCGKIRVESADGRIYEIRNKQTLCRCGKSKNKPFCDSTHRHISFKVNYKNI